MTRTKCTYLALLTVLLLPLTANADLITETGDAGNTPGTAQVIPEGTDLITGTLELFSAADLYLIGWDGGFFEAWTYAGLGGGAFGSFDTMLFLFDYAGSRVLFNDDYASLQSYIRGTVAAGDYYLGITRFATCYSTANVSCFAGTSTGDGTYGTYGIAMRSPTTSVSVPEPGTLALLGIGLAALGLTRRKKAA